MLLKLWWNIVAMWWAAWAIWQATGWTLQGVPQDEIKRRVRERMAQVLKARRAAR